MPNLVYNEAKKRLLDAFAGPIQLSAMQVMLVKSTYVPNADHAALDDGTPDDPKSHELTVGGYARQVLAGVVVAKNTALDFAYLDASDPVFASLLTGETIGGAIIFWATGVGDTTYIPLFFYDLPDTPTNGSTVTIRWADVSAGGVLKAA